MASSRMLSTPKWANTHTSTLPEFRMCRYRRPAARPGFGFHFPFLFRLAITSSSIFPKSRLPLFSSAKTVSASRAAFRSFVNLAASFFVLTDFVSNSRKSRIACSCSGLMLPPFKKGTRKRQAVSLPWESGTPQLSRHLDAQHGLALCRSEAWLSEKLLCLRPVSASMLTVSRAGQSSPANVRRSTRARTDLSPSDSVLALSLFPTIINSALTEANFLLCP